MATFSIAIYTRGKLGASFLESVSWDDVEEYAHSLETLLQGPTVVVEVLEFEG